MHAVHLFRLSAALFVPLILAALVAAQSVPLPGVDITRLQRQVAVLWEGTPAESSPSYDLAPLLQLTQSVEEERARGQVLLAELQDLIEREIGLADDPNDLADRAETVQQQIEVATRVRDSAATVANLYTEMRTLQLPAWYHEYLGRARTAARAEVVAANRLVDEKQVMLTLLDVAQNGSAGQEEWDRLQAEVATRHETYLVAEQEARSAEAEAAAYFQTASSSAANEGPAPPPP